MRKHSLLVISSFPPKGITHHESIVGVASYTKNTLASLPKSTTITVLAEKLPNKEQSYQEANIAVYRLWRRNSLATFPHLFFEITKNHKNTKHIVLAFELAMFGGMLSLIPLPFFLMLLALMGKKVRIVWHQVITDMHEVSGHINMKNTDVRLPVLTILLAIFYRLLLASSTKVIVFDTYLKNQLARFGNGGKITVIPHGVENFKDTPTRDEARKKLGISKNQFIVLYFGFLAWYKGTDWLVDAWKNQDQMKLIIAGGPNPNHVDKPFYREYIESIKQTCKAKNIVVTGFVPQEQIPLYFQAADAIIFPYRTCMSASGPLSMAFSFHKPFLLSEPIQDILETEDMKDLMQEIDIDKESLVFSFDGDLEQKILTFQKDTAVQKKLSRLSYGLAEARSWDKLGRMYVHELFAQ